jgi:hypothetical protein
MHIGYHAAVGLSARCGYNLRLRMIEQPLDRFDRGVT